MEWISKSLSVWRCHLFCRMRFFLIIMMSFAVMTAAAQEITDIVDIAEPTVNAEILTVSSDIGYITFYDADESKHNGRVGMDIPLQSTIVTEEAQRMECVIRRDGKPVVGLIISEVTDFYFDYDSVHEVFYFELHYGRVRVVSNNKIRIETESEYGRIQTQGGDFGIISFIKDDGTVYEGIYDFDGRLNCESKVCSVSESPVRWDRFDTFAGEKATFSENELLWWQDKMLFDLTRLPEEIPYVLENLLYPQRQDVLIANYSNLTVEEKQELAKIVLSGIFRFNLNYFMESNMLDIDHIANISWMPGGIFMNRKLEFYFDFSVGFNVSAVTRGETNNLIHTFNGASPWNPSSDVWSNTHHPWEVGNNPWSFGSDQGDNAGRIVFDVFDDLLMKLGLLRYGFDKPTELAFIQVGNYFDISDRWHYSFMGFNPAGLSHDFKHNSFVTKINTKCFETFIYAEDILPRGLYGLSMKFMTPAKSIRWKLGFSVFADMYDLMKFDKDIESFMPMQNSLNLEFTLFDLPSFGLDLYLNGGINIPFSHNFVSGESMFSDVVSSENVASLFTNIAANLGTSIRFKQFYLVPEFIVDTELNRVGQFDMMYSARRGQTLNSHFYRLYNWSYDHKTNNVNISDIFFGSRLKMRFDDYEYVKFELSYQASVAYSDSWSVESCIYDKLHFTLKANIGDKYKVGFDFSLTYQIENLINVIFSMTNNNFFEILKNQVAYMSMTISPWHVVDIYISGGIRPYEYGCMGCFAYFAQAGVTIKPKVTITKKQ